MVDEAVKLTLLLVLIRQEVCMCALACKNPPDESNCVLAQSLLLASSADTLLLQKFGGVTFVHFMCFTD